MGTVLGMATQTPLPMLPVIITDRSDREKRQRLTRRATVTGSARTTPSDARSS
jgi:hypothetical protein